MVIVVLTIWLARIADRSLAESRRQAAVAEKALAHAAEQTTQGEEANREARRQRQLATVPLLSVTVLGTTKGAAGHLTTQFSVRNPGPAAALDIHLLIYGMSDQQHTEETERTRSQSIPLLGAGEEKRVTINMTDFQNVDNPRSTDEATFSNDWIRVVAICQGILGQRTSMRYSWAANRGDIWTLAEVKTLPDPEDTKWQVIVA